MAAAPPPDNPNYGQIFTKGVKYLKINKVDGFGVNRAPQLALADSLNVNYPDIGGVQYNILTTQDQGSHYLMGVIPNENTSSFNEIRDFNLDLAASGLSKTLTPFDTAVWNGSIDTAMNVVGGNSDGYYNSATDIYTLNAPNIPVSVTSSIQVTSLNGSGTYISLLVPTESIAAFQDGLDFSQFSQLGIQILNSIPITNVGLSTSENQFFATSGGPCFFAGLYIAFGGSIVINQIQVNFDQSLSSTGGSPVIININPEIGNFEYSDDNAVLGNAEFAQYSRVFQKIDYSSAQGLTPINLDLIISGSATKAEVQDSNYSQNGWSNGRYNGSKVTSINFNQ